MTFRLVGLMSAVLLLSLAAFGLLMGHYQDQVMDEVARTASDVGKATLKTFELRGEASVSSGGGGDVIFWSTGAAEVVAHGGPEDGVIDVEVDAGSGRQLVVVARSDPESGLEEVERTLTTTSPDGQQVTRRETQIHVTGPDDPLPSARIQECLDAAAATEQHRRVQHVIRVAEVHTESDPAQGLVLKIPRLTPAAADIDSNTLKYRFEAAPPGGLLAKREDILLPISVGPFDDLFEAMRGRSLFLFVGVFVLGSVLTTGLAAHFTRPIRKLDAAIRQLSAGDLDVSVPSQGRDEIGRLSRAFNEMAGKLRANRDRARELVRREKLSALGRMAAGVAHDVRNPLHSIGLTLQHLSETTRPREPGQSQEFDRSVEIIRGEIRRLDELVGNFLRFARSERQERVPVDLAELLRETLRLVQKESERRGVELELQVEGEAPSILGDAEAIRSAVLNLVLNSFEAMPKGGHLGIRLLGADDEVRLEIEDTGEGIPEEDQDRVFEFAYTTREGGHGLGLAMVHHCVVEEHGGRVTLRSRPAEGTRVSLAFPSGTAKEEN